MAKLLKQITEYYLCSPDFNGLPVYTLKDYDFGEAKRLICDGMVEVIAETDNPHIKHFNRQASIEDQLRFAEKAKDPMVSG